MVKEMFEDEDFLEIFIVNEEFKPIGTVPSSKVLTASRDSKMLSIMSESQLFIPVDISLDFLLNSGVKNKRLVTSKHHIFCDELNFEEMFLDECIDQVLSHPTVGSKSFLITIADRSVGGLTARDQMVGPFQTPVADNAIVLWDFESYGGQVFSLGERSPIAIKDPAAASRMALLDL